MATKRLNIVHVGHVGDKPYSGVATVVPKYLQYQAVHARVAFLNLFNYEPDNSNGVYPTFIYDRDGLSKLPSPFSKPDLVVFHEVYRPKFVEIARWLVKNDIPYIITPHVSLTDTAQKHKKIKKIVGNLMMFNWFIKHAKSIHYLSESEKDQSTAFGSEAYFICNNGIELKGKMKKTFSDKGLKLIYVGRLEIMIKGIDRILDAAHSVHEEMIRRDVKITIRGYDEAKNVGWIQRKISEYGIGDVVELGGALYGDEKIKTILENDCFIQFSRTEGQPLSIMEAMDIGMPCVVTNGTTFSDILEVNSAGFRVSDDPKSIGDSILDISSSVHNLALMSEVASTYAANYFDWGIISKDMINKYAKVLKG